MTPTRPSSVLCVILLVVFTSATYMTPASSALSVTSFTTVPTPVPSADELTTLPSDKDDNTATPSVVPTTNPIPDALLRGKARLSSSDSAAGHIAAAAASAIGRRNSGGSVEIPSDAGSSLPEISPPRQYENRTSSGARWQKVTFDDRALIIQGRRRLLISASMHYHRATPGMWPELMRKVKEGGSNVIQSYVVWSGHEPERLKYNFEGRFDVVRFVRLAAENGLLVTLRLGPFIAAQANQGGLPFWLRSIPGMLTRTDNEPFKAEMKRWIEHLMGVLKDAQLMAWQGGPIILLQIENEYGFMEAAYGESAKRYIQWAGQLAVNQSAGVPWIMCRSLDALPSIIQTCNDFYCCGGLRPAGQPGLWTENWNSWFQLWGCPKAHRPVPDLAFSNAYWIATGGTYSNVYMYFGGTNFEREAGGPFSTTSFDFNGIIDEFGLEREPQFSHLKRMHAALYQCERALFSSSNLSFSIEPYVEAHVYGNMHAARDRQLRKLQQQQQQQQQGEEEGGEEKQQREGGQRNHGELGGEEEEEEGDPCAAFLVNMDDQNERSVIFNGQKFRLPAWSVSILPDCLTSVYTTATMTGQRIVRKWVLVVTSQSVGTSGELAATVVEAAGVGVTAEAGVKQGTGETGGSRSAADTLAAKRGVPAGELGRDESMIAGASILRVEGEEGFAEVEETEDRKSETETNENNMLSWQWWQEPRSRPANESLFSEFPMEQLALTQDTSDYLWYVTRVTLPSAAANATGTNGLLSAAAAAASDVPPPGSAAAAAPPGTVPAELTVADVNDVAHVFVNGELLSSKAGAEHASQRVLLVSEGENEIALLCAKLGLRSGPFGPPELERAGLTGGVLLAGLPGGAVLNLTGNGWEHQVGLVGEAKGLPRADRRGDATWHTAAPAGVPVSQPLTWYRANFVTPPGSAPLAVDMRSMGKGYLWINGFGIGRFWSDLIVGAEWCDMAPCEGGVYNALQCVTRCNEPSQSWFHLPREYLVPPSGTDADSAGVGAAAASSSTNTIVIFDETGGDPSRVVIAERVPASVCAETGGDLGGTEGGGLARQVTPGGTQLVVGDSGIEPELLELSCPDGHTISDITYFGYVTPGRKVARNSSPAKGGKHQAQRDATCHSPSALSRVERACVGRQGCRLKTAVLAEMLTNGSTSPSPCSGVQSSLALTASCQDAATWQAQRAHSQERESKKEPHEGFDILTEPAGKGRGDKWHSDDPVLNDRWHDDTTRQASPERRTLAEDLGRGAAQPGPDARWRKSKDAKWHVTSMCIFMGRAGGHMQNASYPPDINTVLCPLSPLPCAPDNPNCGLTA